MPFQLDGAMYDVLKLVLLSLKPHTPLVNPICHAVRSHHLPLYCFYEVNRL